MRIIKLTIAYDGTRYSGWQIQSNGQAIQALVQRAVRKMTGEETNLLGASRTDTGVHALGQTAHFATGTKIPVRNFVRGLNSILPLDIAVTNAEEVPEGFHAQKSAVGKRYRYLIAVSAHRDPLFEDRAWRMLERPDVKVMKRAARALIGEHDFTSFCAAGSSVKSHVRRLKHIAIRESPPDALFQDRTSRLIVMEFEGNGFLRHMIRNIVGTLVDMGLGKLSPSSMAGILKARNRKMAGRCAPACGLYLVEVMY